MSVSSSSTEVPSIDFSFRLPICLHLQEGFEFSIEVERIGKASISTWEIVEHFDSRLGSAQGFEVNSDTDGGFRYTAINLSFDDPNPAIPLDNLREVYGKLVLDAINTFLDAYRFVTGRYGIANIQDLEKARDFNVGRQGLSQPSQFIATIAFGPGATGLATWLPSRTSEEHQNIQELINSETLLLEDVFLMDAHRQLLIGHEIPALISAITAFEIVVRAQRKPPANLFMRIVRAVSRRDALGKLATTSLVEHHADQMLISLVIGAIRKRNRIVHGQERDKKQIPEYIAAVKQAIATLREVSSVA